jgi:hypothetical protein
LLEPTEPPPLLVTVQLYPKFGIVCHSAPLVGTFVADFVERDGVLIPVKELQGMLLPLDYALHPDHEAHARDYRSRLLSAKWALVARQFRQQWERESIERMRGFFDSKLGEPHDE